MNEDFLKSISNKKCPNYNHFDRRIKFENCKKYIFCPDCIKMHGFYPLISTTIEFKKVKKANNKSSIEKKPKIREIRYASHIDSWIYLYYSYLINEKYNSFCDKHGLNSVSVAYRNCLKKSTIDVANEIFNFIKATGDCYIIVSDFESYFDNIDHKNLRKELCNIFDVEYLPDDLYAVYKNVTKYSEVSKGTIETFIAENKIPKHDNGMYCELSELRKNKIKITKKSEGYGIPQGLSISAVLANVNLCTADLELKNYMDSLNGKYVRYSDDIIFVIPNSQNIDIAEIHQKIKDIYGKVEHLIFSESKTKVLKYFKGKICYSSEEEKATKLDYLGFVFENNQVRLRDKTIYKYTYRLRKKIKGYYNCVKYQERQEKHKPVNKIGIYTVYSNRIDAKKLLKNSKYRRRYKNILLHGNYFSYIKRCMSVFKDSKSIRKGYYDSSKNIKKKMKEIRKESNNLFK